MPELDWKAPAIADLLAIIDYISDDNPDAALALMDEIVDRTGMLPTPLTWPVGQSGDFRGVLDRAAGTYTKFERTDGGATIAGEEIFDAETAAQTEGDAWQTAVDESELLDMEGQNHDQERFLAGQTTPVMFASAVLNFGVHKLLDTLVERTRARGEEHLLLEVRADNAPALALYDRAGFTRLTTRRRYYPGDVDAHVMRLTLEGVS